MTPRVLQQLRDRAAAAAANDAAPIRKAGDQAERVISTARAGKTSPPAGA